MFCKVLEFFLTYQYEKKKMRKYFSPNPESVPMFEEPKTEKLDYLTNNELGLSFLVNDEVELSTDESESPIYSTGGQVELNFTVDLAGGGENVYVENVAIDKYAITDLADIEGDDYVIKFDQQHYNLVQYHINGELKY